MRAFFACVAMVYLALVLLLVTQQRAIIFPARHVHPAGERSHRGGQLVTLPAGDSESQVERKPARVRFRRFLIAVCLQVGTTLAALYFPAPEDGIVVCFFHGNADQIGWGGAFVGERLLRQQQFGTFAVEYPGYGHAAPGVDTPSEASMYGETTCL